MNKQQHNRIMARRDRAQQKIVAAKMRLRHAVAALEEAQQELSELFTLLDVHRPSDRIGMRGNNG